MKKVKALIEKCRKQLIHKLGGYTEIEHRQYTVVTRQAKMVKLCANVTVPKDRVLIEERFIKDALAHQLGHGIINMFEPYLAKAEAASYSPLSDYTTIKYFVWVSPAESVEVNYGEQT